MNTDKKTLSQSQSFLPVFISEDLRLYSDPILLGIDNRQWLRTHPLPRGGTDLIMIVLQESQDFAGRWTTPIPSDKKLSR